MPGSGYDARGRGRPGPGAAGHTAAMPLPLVPPIEPMLAKPVSRLPGSDDLPGGVAYEPKWDGFRALVFRDGDQVGIWGRGGKDLAYAFPEVVDAVREGLPDRVVLDGELVIAREGRLWFEQLQMRLRPRSEAGGWKIAELAADLPATFVGFDLLALGDDVLLDTPYVDRRAQLVAAVAAASGAAATTLRTTPMTRDRDEAAGWFEVFEGAGLDGLIAKGLDTPYSPGKRTMLKLKHARTADAVVAGWRPFKQPGPDGQAVVGSLLLGLYDDAGRLQHIGVAASFPMARRVELVSELAPYDAVDDPSHPWAAWAQAQAAGRLPGAVSRWTGGKDLSFVPLRPDLVVEVAYDQMEGDRLRHTARFLRWRPDREAASCTYDQLERPVRYDLEGILG